MGGGGLNVLIVCTVYCGDTIYSKSIFQITIPEDNVEEFDNRKEKEKKRVKRKLKHFCKFCDLEVHNFARHLERQHYDEFEVQKFNHLEKKNPVRTQLINKLRKEGDFIHGTLVPVQDKQRGETNKHDVLPCIHCKGYYLKSSLRRHIKRCHFNKDVRTSRRYQSEAQTLLCQNFGPDDPLRRSGVLSSLQADDVSLVAKKDKIICELARRYLKCHRDKHLILVAKRQMRRLARLLMEVRKIENNNKLTLLCILHPSKFKTLIAATKSIGGYDGNTRTFNSPSLALQLGTLLKKAIDAAYSLVLQNDINSSLLNVLNITKKIITDDWSTEISTEAGQNLQIKKFNKPTVVPVTEDLAKMKKYLDNLVVSSKLALQDNTESEKAYRELIESTYCNLLLFNRRRVGELQRIPLEIYTKHVITTNIGEFEKILTPSEKVLISNLKRVVIRGKRGRGVPVLFDNLTQEGIDIAIKYRQNFFKNINNVYLFGLCKTENPISGYQVFRKHVTKALGDAQKTTTLTSTKLRKHLATISQILNMKEGDLEQLASFMGHTIKTHSDWYRLPSDIYQTAKVSKLLFISQGNAFDKYKGKNLDEIQVGSEVEEDRQGSESDNEDDGNAEPQEEQMVGIESNESELAGTSQSKKKKKIVRKGWSEKEKQVTEKYFKKHIEKKIAPKKDEVINMMEKNPTLFKGRTWITIKAYVYNQYK
ncbi:hypothetical protein FQR65_LT18254 [Abscondita terminalis]|nr:hypothetical protein FQR65_LT18254 [Abscondita terminalis]